jgi:hypothetical protein
MRRTRLILCAAAGAVLTVLLAVPASAETTHVLAIAGSLDEVINNLRNWLIGILAGLATMFLTLGGVRYVMAAGEPSEVDKAKAAFKSACVGYGLAVLAPVIVQVLRGIVGA